MITLNNISCGYGKKVILSGINMQLKEAELTCLLGKNGVGKTTLFKTILGLLPQLAGSMYFNQHNTAVMAPKDMARLISYVPQAHGASFPFSVKEVVLMGQYAHTSGIFGKPQKENIKVVMDSLDLLGITHLASKNFSKLSGGQKQMVLIARAVAQKPTFIAMDEPTANLDMGNSIRVMKMAQQLRNEGFGVIMNTHNPEHALQFADKVVMLDQGSIMRMGKASDILHSQSISELYNTPIELVDTYTSTGEKRQVLMTL